MMLIPFLTFVLLIVGAVVSGGLVWQRRAGSWTTAVVTLTLALLLWLPLWGALPSLIASTTAAGGVSWAWQIESHNWLMTLIVFVINGVVLLNWRPLTGSDGVEITATPYRFALLLGLLLAQLVALWANSWPSFMLGWVLLSLGWGLALRMILKQDWPRIVARLFYFVAALCLSWLASAWVGNLVGWDVAVWPRPAVAAALLAGAVQVAIWPFSGWRMRADGVDSLAAFWLNVTPALVGLMLLVRLAAVVETTPMAGFLTLAALVTMLWGLYRFALAGQSAGQMGQAVAITAVALPVLVALWTNPADSLSEVRSYALALIILMVSQLRPLSPTRWWRLIPVLVALATLAGMPLTAGFGGRAALYAVWLADGYVALAVVFALLLIGVIAAGLIFIKTSFSATADAPEPALTWLYDVGLFLPLLGLLTVGNTVWTELNPLVWLFALLPMLLGVGLFYVWGRTGMPDMLPTIQRAFTIQLPVRDGVQRGRNTGRELLKGVGTAVDEALLILESDGGFLWVIVIILVIVLIS